MKANLVCKGGGIKGIGLVGSITYLEEQGYEWEHLAGTSIGAVIASLVSVGYTATELNTIINKIDYSQLRQLNKFLSIPIIGEIINLLFYKGLYSIDYLENYLRELFKAKGKTKFKDISLDGESRLKLIATDVTSKDFIILPDDLIKYGLDPMEFDIAKAVIMSASIPFFYTPVKLTHDNKPHYIVDGGVLSNFPVWIFEDISTPSLPTIGLNLLGSQHPPHLHPTNLISYLLDVIETTLSTDEENYFRNDSSIQIINIPTLDITATDFNLSSTQKHDLFLSGYRAAQTFLESKTL